MTLPGLRSKILCSNGTSGQTGMAGGDHIHFGMQLDGVTRVGKMLSDCFSGMATESGEVEIDWKQIRTSIQPEVH